MLNWALGRQPTLDDRIRLEAFRAVRERQDSSSHVTRRDLDQGFRFQGEHIRLIHGQQGIYKPPRMTQLLSIMTFAPSINHPIRYDDQLNAHAQIYEGNEYVDYSFMGSNPETAQNQYLLEAFEQQIPVIYFLGINRSLYLTLMPTFIAGWDARTLSCKLAFDVPDKEEIAAMPEAPERRYALQVVKKRLHQSAFREMVISAYGRRCSLSGLRETQLLDAAHIVPNADEEMGQPIVCNGLPMTKIHHAAFDANLLGIDPDFQIHVSPRLLEQRDGPMLEALKRLQGSKLRLPRRVTDYPDKERLAQRYAEFQLM